MVESDPGHDGRRGLARVHGAQPGRRGPASPSARGAATPPTSELAGRARAPVPAVPGLDARRGGHARAPGRSRRSAASSSIEPALTIKIAGRHGGRRPGRWPSCGATTQLHEREAPARAGRDVRPGPPGRDRRRPSAREAGFVGPVGPRRAPRSSPTRRSESRVLRGRGQQGRTRTCGAWCPGRDFQRRVRRPPAGRPPATPARSAGRRSRVERVIEIGNIFKLGTKYSEPAGGASTSTSRGRSSRSSWAATASARRASPRRPSSRTTTRTASIWPEPIAPFDVHLLRGQRQGREDGRRRPRRSTRRLDGGGSGGAVRRPGRTGRREVQGRRPPRAAGAHHGGQPGVEGGGRGGAPPPHGRGVHSGPGRQPGPRPDTPGPARVSQSGLASSGLWRWGPVVLWMALISVGSTDVLGRG
ncbi:MAG: hypothetical protein MZV64_70685 [Ignavibacteriales bacterium]|nr:hypothetical protein [Ignavibacteriales bacterium]